MVLIGRMGLGRTWAVKTWVEKSALSLLLTADKFRSSDSRYKSVHSSIPKLNSGRVGCTVILSRSEGEVTGKKAGELAIQARR